MKRTLLILIAVSIVGISSCTKDEGATDQSKEIGVVATFIIDPTIILNAAYWADVQSALAKGPVDVIFEEGIYTRNATLILSKIGHTDNLLTIKGEAKGDGVVINGSIDNLMDLNGCKNVKLQGFKFTGVAKSYALRVINSQNITIEKCAFVDLSEVGFGALGVHYALTNGVVVKYCTFENVGKTSAAHMIYGAYGVQRLSVVSNSFKNCAGAFVRFRGDLSDKGVVYGNTFTSTGTYLGFNPPFIEVPVFNDVDPGDERMGTNFMVTKNTFSYGTEGLRETRFALVFHSSGNNPPGRNYLISAADGLLMQKGTVEQKKNIMLNQLGLTADKIRFGGNTNINVGSDVIFRVQNGYGSAGQWEGIADITSTVNSSGLNITEEQALRYYQ